MAIVLLETAQDVAEGGVGPLVAATGFELNHVFISESVRTASNSLSNSSYCTS